MDEIRKRDIRHFLRQLRDLRGLTQIALAEKAGIGSSYYRQIETGQLTAVPSAEILDAVAGALRMEEDERQHLHLLVRGDVPTVVAGDAPLRLLKDFVARQGKLPVLALDVIGDVLAHSQGANEWLTDWDAKPEAERNILRWTFYDPSSRERLAPWAEIARAILGSFRALRPLRDDPRTDPFLTELLERSEDARRMWQHVSPRNPAEVTRALIHPRHGVVQVPALIQCLPGRPDLRTATFLVPERYLT